MFTELGWNVISVDNYMRGKLFGSSGNTESTIRKLETELNIEHHEIDIRDDKIKPLIKRADAVIHAASQPSHPRSIEIPIEDFNINAWGTLFLLEIIRLHNKDTPFVFCSTNKVYGEMPNFYSYKTVGKRLEPVDPSLYDGFDETLRIDRNMHTPFGVSKATGDLYSQEYAHMYGLKTGIFRMGCITGGAAKAVEQHNWEPYFVSKAITGEVLNIYGHGGFQVRDVIHARDLSVLFFEFINKPVPGGQVYNIGGGRKNSISLLEAIDLIEEITGKKMNYRLDKEREADHRWWISNINKAKNHYPGWSVDTGLEEIFTEIYNELNS